MGRSKQLLEIDGAPLLVQSARVALSTGIPVTVVLGAEAEAHESVLRGLPVDQVLNPQWALGMGRSLKVGLQQILLTQPQTDAILVMLCDQPKVSAQHVRALLEKGQQTKKNIVASAYSNSLGVPALFKQPIFSDLLALDDSAGAAKLIRARPENVAVVPFPEGAIDLDTPEDVARYRDGRQ